MLSDEKILITGPTSQVAFPLARELAKHNQVYGLARFRTPEQRERIESIGVRCVQADLAEDSLEGVPTDFSYVLNFAVVKSGDFDYDLAANAEGAGRLMAHCRSARAFLHCSSAGVYQPAGQRPLKETDPLGDSHRFLFPTYSISKIAAETVVRFGARHWNLPTTIARFSVPYGDNGGWPWYHLMMMKGGTPISLRPDGPNLYNPIHEDLGRQRAGQHRGVVRLPGRAHGPEARVQLHRGELRQPARGSHAHARVAGKDPGRLARRDPPDGPDAQSGTAATPRGLGAPQRPPREGLDFLPRRGLRFLLRGSVVPPA
jgi:hypothetical protein